MYNCTASTYTCLCEFPITAQLDRYDEKRPAITRTLQGFPQDLLPTSIISNPNSFPQRFSFNRPLPLLQLQLHRFPRWPQNIQRRNSHVCMSKLLQRLDRLVVRVQQLEVSGRRDKHAEGTRVGKEVVEEGTVVMWHVGLHGGHEGGAVFDVRKGVVGTVLSAIGR